MMRLVWRMRAEDTFMFGSGLLYGKEEGNASRPFSLSKKFSRSLLDPDRLCPQINSTWICGLYSRFRSNSRKPLPYRVPKTAMGLVAGSRIHPSLPEALHDVLRLGPQGHHTYDPVGVHHLQFVAAIKGDEFHLWAVYTKNRAKGIWEVPLPSENFCGKPGVVVGKSMGVFFRPLPSSP